MTARAVLIAVCAAAVVMAIGAIYFTIRNDGRATGAAAERSRINRENDNAADQAERARSAYDECIGARGVYDFAKSACRR